MPKKELRRYYQWFMVVLPERIKELAEAVTETPGFEGWQPDFTPASLDALGQWFAGQVASEETTCFVARSSRLERLALRGNARSASSVSRRIDSRRRNEGRVEWYGASLHRC